MEFERAPLPADGVPEQICEACALNGIFHRPTRTAAVYCEHSMTGAVYPLGGAWGIVPAAEDYYFREWLVRTITRAELLGDIARAFAQALIEESTRSTKH
jgi:hypothetical protein